jgi:hypothetical protein
MAKIEIHEYIAEDLRSLAYPIDKLELLPGNPRKGNVEAVARSLEAFGQRKTIVARRKDDSDVGIVLAGNTTLQGGRKLGWSHIAVTWVDDDDKTAAAFALADNRTHDLGEYDDQALIDMMEQVKDDYAMFDATGYDLADEQELLEKINRLDDDIPEIGSDGFDDGTEDAPKAQNPVIQYTIIFDDEEQQAIWYEFMRWLKREHKELDTAAERITLVIKDLIPKEIS